LLECPKMVASITMGVKIKLFKKLQGK